MFIMGGDAHVDADVDAGIIMLRSMLSTTTNETGNGADNGNGGLPWYVIPWIILAVLIVGYYASKLLTRYRKNKINAKNANAGTRTLPTSLRSSYNDNDDQIHLTPSKTKSPSVDVHRCTSSLCEICGKGITGNTIQKLESRGGNNGECGTHTIKQKGSGGIQWAQVEEGRDVRYTRVVVQGDDEDDNDNDDDHHNKNSNGK